MRGWRIRDRFGLRSFPALRMESRRAIEAGASAGGSGPGRTPKPAVTGAFGSQQFSLLTGARVHEPGRWPDGGRRPVAGRSASSVPGRWRGTRTPGRPPGPGERPAPCCQPAGISAPATARLPPPPATAAPATGKLPSPPAISAPRTGPGLSAPGLITALPEAVAPCSLPWVLRCRRLGPCGARAP